MILSSSPLIVWLLAAPLATQVVVGIIGSLIAAAALAGLAFGLYKVVKYVHTKFFKKEAPVADLNNEPALEQVRKDEPAVSEPIAAPVVNPEVRTEVTQTSDNAVTVEVKITDKPINKDTVVIDTTGIGSDATIKVQTSPSLLKRGLSKTGESVKAAAKWMLSVLRADVNNTKAKVASPVVPSAPPAPSAPPLVIVPPVGAAPEAIPGAPEATGLFAAAPTSRAAVLDCAAFNAELAKIRVNLKNVEKLDQKLQSKRAEFLACSYKAGGINRTLRNS